MLSPSRAYREAAGPCAVELLVAISESALCSRAVPAVLWHDWACRGAAGNCGFFAYVQAAYPYLKLQPLSKRFHVLTAVAVR